MSTISVPLPPHIEESLENLIKSGYGSNKADVVRKAILRASEEEAIQAILKAQQEILEGKGLKGDLKDLLEKVR